MGALVFATQDHKPDVIAEQARIQTAGGEVRSEIYELQGLSRNMQLTNIGRPHCKAPTETDQTRLKLQMCTQFLTWTVLDWQFDFVDKSVAKAWLSQAAYAKLPPLEDIPLEDIGATRQGKLGEESDTFFGISFQVWLFVILGAVTWAATWVLNLKPAKDAEGTYKTYIGAGALPPDGFTNPADPRVQEELTDEDDDLYSDDLRPGAPKGQKAASSAIV
ncbi:unnamed protein product [Durusdinium trenchii]|uniref:Uncharacterized protein n=1 Tax=Durusdinium trenchii TaxID=1381693 RepID=A0ABP0MTU7_9DINO